MSKPARIKQFALIDPRLFVEMTAAFDEACFCALIQPYSEHELGRLARYIIEVAETGVKDRESLRDFALARFMDSDAT